MGQRFRRGFTAAEKTELWDRWQRGESLKAIGRAFGKLSSSIYFQVAPHGPAPRRRSRLALTLSEREEISRGIAAHQSARSMARLLGRSASTVSSLPRRKRTSDLSGTIPAKTMATFLSTPVVSHIFFEPAIWLTVEFGFVGRC
jgi:DNA-binding CsgD family transcriptional regulator